MSTTCSNIFFNFPGSKTFGFYGEYAHNSTEGVGKSWPYNVFLIAGYIPGVSLLTGLYRIVIVIVQLWQFGWKGQKYPATLLTFAIRGVGEALQVGWVFIVVDIFITLGRIATHTYPEFN